MSGRCWGFHGEHRKAPLFSFWMAYRRENNHCISITVHMRMDTECSAYNALQCTQRSVHPERDDAGMSPVTGGLITLVKGQPQHHWYNCANQISCVHACLRPGAQPLCMHTPHTQTTGLHNPLHPV